MPKSRRKISAVEKEFSSELLKLVKIDADIQSRYSSNPNNFSKHQIFLVTEAIFFRAYRTFEGFIRDIFILYCQEKPTSSEKKVTSYVKPKSFKHAEILIQSSLSYLDWSNPDIMITRAETYLKDGFPIRTPFTVHKEKLLDYRRIRNRIAHDSKEAESTYEIVLRKHFGTVPIKIPPPGEFLLLVNQTSSSSKYYLLEYFDLLIRMSKELTFQ